MTETQHPLPCEAWQETVSAYFDGELSPDETKNAERHLADCAACRAYLASLSALSDVLRAAAPPLPASLHETIMAGVRAAQSEETQTPDTPARRVVPLHRKRTWWRIGGVSVAALLCLTLAAGPFFFRGRLSDTEKSMGMAAPYSLMAEDEMPDEVAGDVCEANSLCLYALPTEDEDGFGYENAIPNDWPMGAEETDGGMRANSAENDCESTTGRALCMEDSAACERQACLFPGSLPATVRRSRLWPRPVGSVRP